MADLRVSELEELELSEVEASDPMLVSDLSASESKKITIKNLISAGVTKIDDNTIPYQKIDSSTVPDGSIDGGAIGDDTLDGEKIVDNSVDGGLKLKDGSVTTVKLADDAVTADKIAQNTVAGGATGNIGLKTITADNLADGSVGADALQEIQTGSIADDAITGDKIADGAVDGGTHIVDNSITEDKYAAESVGTGAIKDDAITSGKILDRTITGADIALGTIEGENIKDGAIGADQLADLDASDIISDGSITGDLIGPGAVDRGLDLSTDAIGHTNAVTAGKSAGISFDAQGHVTAVEAIDSSDLPPATTTELGAVIVPTDSGLTVAANGSLDHENSVTAGSVSGLTIDEHGHVTAYTALTAGDIPIATTTEVGGVSVPSGALTVATDGALTHDDVTGLTPGEYTKVTVDQRGHVTAAQQLEDTDIPDISADKITSGTFPVNQATDSDGDIIGDTLALADNSITARHVKDYTTVLMQVSNPGTTDLYGQPHFLGRLWFNPETSQLSIFARSSDERLWLPVGFGVMTQNNLRMGGTYDSVNSTIPNVTTFGTTAGLSAGDAIPAATPQLLGIYLVCVEAGGNISVPDLDGDTHTNGDWIVCLGDKWVHVDVTSDSGGGGGGGAQRLDDLLDVTINSTYALDGISPTALVDGQLLQYAGGGQWTNNETIDGGSF